MFIEGGEYWGMPGRRSSPPELWSQVFLATVMIADGLELLLRGQDGAEQESTVWRQQRVLLI